MAVTLAGVMVVTLVGAPQPAQAQLGILQAIQAVLNVINGVIQTALTSINTVRTALNNLQQLVVWPQQLINQARAQVTQMIGQYRNLMSNIFHIKLNSATLPNPQALEAVIRDHQVNNFPGLTATFANVYGAIPVATAANPGDRAMSDMDDASGARQLEDVEGWRPGNGHRTSIGGCDREFRQPGSARFCAVPNRDGDYLRHSRSGPDAKAAGCRIAPGSSSHRTSQHASQRERHQHDRSCAGSS